jgi:peptidoglycan/LPS O-acetylase OafA/YrhL
LERERGGTVLFDFAHYLGGDRPEGGTERLFVDCHCGAGPHDPVYASIVFGVLAAVVARQYGDLHGHILVRPFLFGITAATAAGIAMGVDYDLLAPFCALGIILLLAVRGRANRLGAIIGGMSYPLYLNHWIRVFASNFLLAPAVLRGSIVGHVLSYALNIAIATTHYWCIDRNMLAMRGKLFAPELGQALAIAAYILIGLGIAGGILLTAH